MVHYSLLGCSSDVFQSHPIASPLRRSNPACGEPDRPQKLHHIMSTENPDRIIRINAVLARTGLTRSTLYRKVQNGKIGRATCRERVCKYGKIPVGAGKLKKK